MNSKELAKKRQAEVLDQATKLINSGENEIVISGAAGTGKSFITRQLLENILRTRRNAKILVCALSHQAVGVASGFLGNGRQLKNLKTATVASALKAKKVILPDGKVTFKPQQDKNGKPSLMASSDIIVIDECSQISKVYLDLINEVRKPNSIVIYLGDVCQLPPPERQPNELTSPVFNKKNIFELIHPFRYEGYIAEVGLFLREEILKGINNGGKVDVNIWKQLLTKNNNEVHFYNDKNRFVSIMIDQFKIDNDFTKYIAYTRENHERTGIYIRNILNPNKPPFDPGDKIICRSNYYDEDILKVQNGQEFKITGKRLLKTYIIWVMDYGYQKFVTFEYQRGVSETDMKKFYADIFNLDIKNVLVEEFQYWSHDFNNEIKFVRTLPKNEKRYKEILSYLTDQNNLYGQSEYRNVWEAKNAFEEHFCDIKYAYAMTSHTSQGSTYKNVFVNLENIMAVTKITDLEKLQSLYVAITRASNSVKLFY